MFPRHPICYCFGVIFLSPSVFQVVSDDYEIYSRKVERADFFASKAFARRCLSIQACCLFLWHNPPSAMVHRRQGIQSMRMPQIYVNSGAAASSTCKSSAVSDSTIPDPYLSVAWASKPHRPRHWPAVQSTAGQGVACRAPLRR